MSLVPPQPALAEADANEMSASDAIPYAAHYDDETVLTRDDGLAQTIAIDGLYFESLTRKQIRRFERDRNTVFREIAASNRGVCVHVIRRQVDLYPAGECHTWFARAFNEAWRTRVAARRMYINKIYITVVENQFRQDAPGLIDRAIAAVRNRKGTLQRERVLERLSQRLNSATDSIVKGLGGYGARKLRIQRWPELAGDWVTAEQARAAVERFQLSWTEFQRRLGERAEYGSDDLLDYLGPEFSEISGFLSYLVNLQEARQPVSDLPLNQSLAQSWIDCKTVGNMMCVENMQGSRAAAVLSMAEWPSHTSSRMLDDFLKKPVEFIVSQSFFYTDRISAEHELRLARRRMTVNDKEGVSEDDSQEIVQGIKALTRGEAVNGKHHLSILVHVPVATAGRDRVENRRLTIEALDAAVHEVTSAFTPLGVKSVREWYGMETFFWARLPGAEQFISRRGKIKSSNFAGFASLHNYAVGKLDGNLWGPAIIVLETESGTPYLFNFHREQEGTVAGHMAVAASTGAGKTAFVAALVAMADKAKPRVFWFDNREGAAIFMRAMGGTHTTLTALGTTGWNPFRLCDTLENRAYLLDLLVLMRTCYGGSCSAGDMEAFKKAINENYKLPERDRRLSNIAWCFGHGELGKVMRSWHGADGEIGANAGVFDNEDDNLDVASCRHLCFEMRQLMRDGGVARPELPVVLSYPFHRVEQSMDGEPFIIVLDEGQNLVRHAYWREKIDAYFNQIRRKNGVMVFITPDVKFFYSETDSILKQAVTRVYLSNAEGQLDEHVRTGITPEEFAFVRDTPSTARKLLIRRGQESIRVKFDLSDHPATRKFIPVLSANDKAVALMHRVIAEVGSSDPAVWVPVFMERSMAENTHNLRGA